MCHRAEGVIKESKAQRIVVLFRFDWQNFNLTWNCKITFHLKVNNQLQLAKLNLAETNAVIKQLHRYRLIINSNINWCAWCKNSFPHREFTPLKDQRKLLTKLKKDELNPWSIIRPHVTTPPFRTRTPDTHANNSIIYCSPRRNIQNCFIVTRLQRYSLTKEELAMKILMVS